MGALFTLGDHITTQKGYAFKSKWFESEGTPVVKVSDFTEDSISPSNLVKISEELANDYQKYKLATDDVVIQTVGSWPSNPASVVGKTIRVPSSVSGALLNQNAVRIEPADTLQKGFLFYLLRSDHFKDYIIGTAQGAASQASITLDAIRSYKFECPDFDQQSEISDVLSNYDNLIENNNRRIAILEEMAQSLYREWFVKFCYPGHENQTLVDSPLGDIPEEWEVRTIEECYKTSSGGTPSRKKPEYYGDDHWWVKTKELKDGFVTSVEEKISDLGLSKSSAKLFPKDSVLLAMYGATIGRLGILTHEASTNQACCALIPLEEKYSPWFIYLTLLEKRPDLLALGQGAAQQNISQQVIKGFKILIPQTTLLEQFSAAVEPMFRQIEVLLKSNLNLKKQRDMLLPKLISGKINL